MPGAWHRRRRTWWTTSLRTCRCASGCFLCRSRLRQAQTVHWTVCVRAQLLLAAQPKLVTPVLQVVHRVITRHLLGQAGLKPDEADSGAVTLIQRFGSAANLNIHLHCLVLDGVYRRSIDGTPEFVEVPEPTDEALQSVLRKIITRTMKLLTRRGVLVEEEGSTYIADNDGDSDEARTLRPLQAAACILPCCGPGSWRSRGPGSAKAMCEISSLATSRTSPCCWGGWRRRVGIFGSACKQCV